MKKMMIALIATGLIGSAWAQTNYISPKIGMSKAEDSVGVDYDSSLVGSLAVGRILNTNETFAIELQVKYQRLEFNSEDQTVTTVDGTAGTDAVIPQRKGRGRGSAYGWHRRNPIIPATDGTVSTTSVADVKQEIEIDLLSLMVNVQYRLANDTMFTPYVLAGAGATWAQLDSVHNTDNEVGFAYQGGLGINIGDDRERMYVDVGIVFTKDIYTSDFEVDGVNYLIGLVYRF
jgi:opacity protein-like surface antigen